MKAIKKLLFGETWVLPIGIALSVGAGALLGAFALLAGALVTLVVVVARTARRRGGKTVTPG